MNEMLEKIAAALEPKCRAFGKGDMPIAVAREFARTALEAIGSPSEDLCRAGVEATGIGWGFGVADAEVCFNAMIDAALSSAPIGEK